MQINDINSLLRKLRGGRHAAQGARAASSASAPGVNQAITAVETRGDVLIAYRRSGDSTTIVQAPMRATARQAAALAKLARGSQVVLVAAADPALRSVSAPKGPSEAWSQMLLIQLREQGVQVAPSDTLACYLPIGDAGANATGGGIALSASLSHLRPAIAQLASWGVKVNRIEYDVSGVLTSLSAMSGGQPLALLWGASADSLRLIVSDGQGGALHLNKVACDDECLTVASDVSRALARLERETARQVSRVLVHAGSATPLVTDRLAAGLTADVVALGDDEALGLAGHGVALRSSPQLSLPYASAKPPVLPGVQVIGYGVLALAVAGAVVVQGRMQAAKVSAAGEQQVAQAKTKMAEAEQRLAQAKSDAAGLNRVSQSDLQLLEQTVAAKRLAVDGSSAVVPMSALLAEIAQATPDAAWISSIATDGKHTQIKGRTMSAADINAYVTRLNQLPSFAALPVSVASYQRTADGQEYELISGQAVSVERFGSVSSGAAVGSAGR